MMQTKLGIKCLLGDQDRADLFLEKLQHYGEEKEILIVSERQLNHHFSGGTILDIHTKLSSRMSMQEAESLFHLAIKGRHHTVSTRSILPGDRTFLVISCPSPIKHDHHGLVSVERESEFFDKTLDELDLLLLDIGREYQSKKTKISTWYRVRDINVRIDYDPDCGCIAEFETMIALAEDITSAQERLKGFLSYFGVQELSHDVLRQLYSTVDHYRLNVLFNLSDPEIVVYRFEG